MCQANTSWIQLVTKNKEYHVLDTGSDKDKEYHVLKTHSEQ